MPLKQQKDVVPIHHHHNHHYSEQDFEKIYREHLPIPFSSTLRDRLKLLSFNPPIESLETTLSEQYYFQRINDKNFLGHHNLVLAADIIPKSQQQQISNLDIEIVKAEGEKLKEKCRKCIDILKYRHPMLCAIPTLKDKLKKKINTKISSHSDNLGKVLHDMWTKEIVQTRGTIQFEIVEQISVDVQVLLDENSINPENIEIENEEELVKLLINHEITHSWNILGDPDSIQAMWKLTIIKSKHTDGKWVCCFTFFHALCDATSIKIFLEEFASLFDYMYGEVQIANVEKELMEVKRKALENIRSLLPPSPIQILEMLKSKSNVQKKKNDQSPTETGSTSSSSSTSSVPIHHHAESDIPKKLGKLGGLLFYSKFVSQVISYNGLSPIISFPLKSPYPEPAQTKVLIRHVKKLTLNKLIEKTKTLDLTVTAIVQSIGCLAWVLSSRLFNEKAQEKTNFGFTNTITVDFREGILLPLSRPKDIFRNYSSALLSTTKLHIPHNISPDNESDIEKLIEIILDGSYQTRNCLNKKYHDTLSTYQIVHKFLKFDISKKESFQMVFSNIGKLENLTGQNVRFELISAAYSSIGNTNGVSNIFYTNSRTGELIFSICYPESVHYEHVQNYLENLLKCLELFSNHKIPQSRRNESKEVDINHSNNHQ